MFIPKFFTTLRDTTPRQVLTDCVSGVVVGVVALPLAIAFAIASGVTPDRGLVTAVVAGFLVSLLGGSRVSIGGPTGAFVVIVYAIVQKHGIDGLLIATLMGGGILVVMGFARLGSAIKFIPYPIIVGFTTGIAVIIFSSQLNDFFGLGIARLPAEFIPKWQICLSHMRQINWHAFGIAALTVLIVTVWRRVSKAIPGSLVALLIVTWAAHQFNLSVETIGGRFGDIPHTLPIPALPHLSWERIRELIPSAITIALLGGIESLLCAVVSDGMIGGRHRSSMELVAQGIANIASALFGGMPATSAIARTTVNVQNGGRTPLAGIVHALTLLGIMFFLGRWVALVPMAYLAGILAVVAYHMSEWHSFLQTARGPRRDTLVLVTTFGLTVLVDLTVAIGAGMVMAAFLFMREIASLARVDRMMRDHSEASDSGDVKYADLIHKGDLPPDVAVYEVSGPLFFAVTHKFSEALRAQGSNPKVRIIRMRFVDMIDASGIRALREEWKTATKQDSVILLCEIPPRAFQTIHLTGLDAQIGADRILPTFKEACSLARLLRDRANAGHAKK